MEYLKNSADVEGVKHKVPIEEMTDEEREKLRQIRRERRKRAKEARKKKKEEEKRLAMVAPQSSKIQIIPKDVLQNVQNTSSSLAQKQPLTRTVSADASSAAPTTHSAEASALVNKAIRFLDDEYPTLESGISLTIMQCIF